MKRNKELREGQLLNGFRVVRITPLADQRAVAYQLEHVKTGAKLLHLFNDDAENLFSLTFPTPPADDTGVPHILEHAVLSGSRRFPVKDPFFEMIKQSMATFINAMTGADCTYYPVCSNVRRDYYNLAEVYWDAVFYPNLTELTFAREGHHLEPADRAKPEGDLAIKGIVYNEMKGAFSSPNAIVGRASYRGLYPDTPYGHESGGDPKYIPTLSYQQFRDFHARFYHPSNAYIFLYGDIALADHLAWLQPRMDLFERRQVDASVPDAKPWTEPREKMIGYPVGQGDSTDGKTWITINWLTGDATDAQEVMAFSVLEALLLGNHAAPLRKAIIDSKLGADLANSGYNDGLKQSSFHLGIKGSEADRKQEFVDLVFKALDDIAREGFAAEAVDSAFQQLAYSHLEIATNHPLRQLGAVKQTWLHGRDPLEMIRASVHLQQLRKRYERDGELFSRMIRRRLIDNPHRLTCVFTPDPEMAGREEEALRNRLKAVRQRLSEADLKHLVKQAEELDALAATPNSAEAIATLPRLNVTDLPRVPRRIPTTVETLDGGIDFLRNDVFANGVNYLLIDFDLAHLPVELVEYLPLYGDCVRKMGAGGHDYLQIAKRQAAATGGITFSPYCTSHSTDPSRTLLRGQFGMKFLDANTDAALSLLKDLIFSSDPRDAARLRDVIGQSAAGHRSNLVEHGLSIAQRHAGRTLNREAYLGEMLGGLPQTRLVTGLSDKFDARHEDVIAKMGQIRGLLLGRSGLAVSFTGSAGVTDSVRRAMVAWGGEMSGDAKPAVNVEAPAAPGAIEGLAGPMQVAFCSRLIPAPHGSDPVSPLLSLGARLVSLDYLLDEIRFKGTAYGGGCGYGGSMRSWNFFSYRDPHVKRTLEVFDRTVDFVRGADWSQSTLDRAIISTAKTAEKPIRPAHATDQALHHHLLGETAAVIEQHHAALLDATAEKVKSATLDHLEKNYPLGRTCVVSSREKLGEVEMEVEEMLG